MSDIAIRVEHLSKQYRLGGRQAPYQTFREALIDTTSAPIRWLKGERREQNMFWALEDVSFEIKHGEAVGIIGRNGAGKSTLLKVLSSITSPTRGRVELYGRVGSLLEVGTGFHPELTGRENIFLNGAILGMSRAEIQRKFDEIVDFAEVEKFLDTAVKFYSSGMYVRLAFAVAAHLEPEILVVDEVLAVGDAQFQRKCLGKMEMVSHEGRTVLFVSHNMSAIAALCSRSLWLDNGTLKTVGETNEVVNQYLESFLLTSANVSLDQLSHYGNGKARFTDIAVYPLDSAGNFKANFIPGDDIIIKVTTKAFENVTDANVAIIIYDANGYRLIDANLALKNQYVSFSPNEGAVISFRLQELMLKPDRYLVGLWMGRPNIEDIDGVLYATSFSIDVDPDNVQHSQIFPGVYQCKFQAHVDGVK